jgi:hypothetical protein
LSSDLIAVTVGVVLGFSIVGLVLWRHRVEVKQSWQARFGSVPATAPRSSVGRRDHRALSPGARRFGIGLSLLVSFANAALAVQTADARAIHVVGAVVFAISAGALMLKSRRLEEG